MTLTIELTPEQEAYLADEAQKEDDPDYRRLRYVRYADDVRPITTCSIPLAQRRGSEDMTSGSTAYPKAKA